MSNTLHMKTYFDDFLKNIRLSEEQKKALVDAHTELRDNLNADTSLSDVLVSTFLQGSYRRSTIIKPASGQSSDVDVVVVTNISEEEYTPAEALDLFLGFLEEHYPNQYERQGRSWGIHLEEADIDLVPTSAPSEALSESAAIRNSVFSSLDIEALSNPEALSKVYGSRTASTLDTLIESDDWKNDPLRIPD